ncbi:hypothetical protein FJZ48_00255 [Candidatus Uhrbacteria bacterium]|nr:hypothetical protein [Candidatus Uhrbacteria bacterium]
MNFDKKSIDEGVKSPGEKEGLETEGTRTEINKAKERQLEIFSELATEAEQVFDPRSEKMSAIQGMLGEFEMFLPHGARKMEHVLMVQEAFEKTTGLMEQTRDKFSELMNHIRRGEDFSPALLHEMQMIQHELPHIRSMIAGFTETVAQLDWDLRQYADQNADLLGYNAGEIGQRAAALPQVFGEVYEAIHGSIRKWEDAIEQAHSVSQAIGRAS